jgi:glycosyltransferase involved in cell wall biosynthesis
MISIVTAYINRKNLLINTLLSITKSEIKDFELIVVDDCSNEDQRIEGLCEIFPFLRVIRIEPHQKWYVNPCVPFNIGFKEAKGDIVIIQNPECYHYDDILSYVENNLKENDYFSFSCYSLPKEKNINLLEYVRTDFFNNQSADNWGDDAWYNHSIYRPAGYHFCSAIFKTELEKLGGFDQRYAHGICFDDNEILERIKRKGMCVSIVDQKKVLHQWHDSVSYNLSNHEDLQGINRDLFYNTTMKETNWSANKIDYKGIYESSFKDDYYNHHPDDEYRFQLVKNYVIENQIKRVIDIGSGRGNVIKILQDLDPEIEITSTDLLKFHNFECKFHELNLCDPATYIKGVKFELLVCLDVLEHIQKEWMEDVFNFFSTISTNLILTVANHSDIKDGVELHLIQEDMGYWKPMLEKFFQIEYFNTKYDGRLYLLVLKNKNIK